MTKDLNKQIPQYTKFIFNDTLKIMLNPSIVPSPSECEIINMETSSFLPVLITFLKSFVYSTRMTQDITEERQFSTVKHIIFIQIKSKYTPKFNFVY